MGDLSAVTPPPRGLVEEHEVGGGGTSMGPPSALLAEQALVKHREKTEGHVHTSSSEEDIPNFVIDGAKVGTVHVHGGPYFEQAHKHVERPVHHDVHGNIKYSEVAKEEMHDVYQHPPTFSPTHNFHESPHGPTSRGGGGGVR